MSTTIERPGVLESLLLGTGLGLLPPLAGLILGWWGSAALAIYGLVEAGEGLIRACALGGLLAGVLADLRWLPRLVGAVYRLDWRLPAAGYLLLSLVSFAFWMGVPLGQLVPGLLAGLYLGRRLHFDPAGESEAERTIRRGAWFTAGVTLPACILSAALALASGSTPSDLRGLLEMVGLRVAAIAWWQVWLLILAGGPLLVWAQFLLTRRVARLARGWN